MKGQTMRSSTLSVLMATKSGWFEFVSTSRYVATVNNKKTINKKNHTAKKQYKVIVGLWQANCNYEKCEYVIVYTRFIQYMHTHVPNIGDH